MYTVVQTTLTEVFPWYFLRCKANAGANLAKMGQGPHSSKLVVIRVVLLLFVLFYVVFVFVLFCVLFACKCVLYHCPIAIDKYVISYQWKSVSCKIHAHAVLMWMHIQCGRLQPNGFAVHKTYICGYQLCHATGDLWCIKQKLPFLLAYPEPGTHWFDTYNIWSNPKQYNDRNHVDRNIQRSVNK